MSCQLRAPTSSPGDGAQDSGEWDRIDGWSKTHGDSFYVLDGARFCENFHRFAKAFASKYTDARIAYSYKTNYTPAICRMVHDLGGYAEVVSEMEYRLARKLGVCGDRIIYNGPCKSEASLRDALLSGAIVNVDSLRDYTNVMSVASAEPARHFSVGLRCNFPIPEFLDSRFGLDTAGAEFRLVTKGIRASKNVTLSGLHCHFPCRSLESFEARARGMVEIAARVFSSPPAFLNMGGGFFGEMPESVQRAANRQPVGFDRYAETICSVLNAAYGSEERAPVLYVEPGTALVADTLRYYAQVVNIKTVRGRRIATVAGSLLDISPHARFPHLPFRIISKSCNASGNDCATEYDIAGFTCIEGDYLSKRVVGSLEVGDFVEYGNLGSYSIVMRPPFILPAPPILQILEDGDVSVIRRRQTGADVFGAFVETNGSEVRA